MVERNKEIVDDANVIFTISLIERWEIREATDEERKYSPVADYPDCARYTYDGLEKYFVLHHKIVLRTYCGYCYHK